MLEFLVSWAAIFSPPVAVFIFAIVVLFIINICYKYLMDQGETKRIKERTKELNREWKKYQKAGDAEKATKTMNDMMAENSKIMKMSLKPMLVSMVIIILLLPGLAGIYGNKTAELKENKGVVEIDGKEYQLSRSGDAMEITGGGKTITCAAPCREKIGSSRWNIAVNENKVMLERIVALLPATLPLFGDDLGWLGWYFIITIPLMIIIKKILKVNV